MKYCKAYGGNDPELRKAGFFEYTIPDKPNSRLQKYRLTYEGRRLLKSMQESFLWGRTTVNA
jgi:hypothetical protein